MTQEQLSILASKYAEGKDVRDWIGDAMRDEIRLLIAIAKSLERIEVNVDTIRLRG